MYEIDENTVRMPMLALRGLVLFPNMILHFDVGREKSIAALNKAMNDDQYIYLVAQKDIRDDDPQDYEIYDVGVVAQIRQILKMPGDSLRVLVEGVYRGHTKEIVSTSPYLDAVVEKMPLNQTTKAGSVASQARMRTLKELFEEYCYLYAKVPKEIILNVLETEDPVYIVEYIAGNIMLKVEQKQKILEQSSALKRLDMLIKYLDQENKVLALEKDIYAKVKDQIDENQREYYLREQMRAISEELGEGEDVQTEVEDYQKKIAALEVDEESREKLFKEADRLYKMPSNSHEAAVIRSWLDVCLDLPFNDRTKDKIDIAKAQKYLDKEHYGLKKIKQRILELLAVRVMAPDIKGQIICLVGPPGVGKTSIARSIAATMGRKYARVSLGGVRDESDIRGHRKTYIGAMPGRIITAIQQAGTRNPLILLDEIDKMGNDFRGDPSAAMLEVLDSEQNNAFRDHYVEIPFDLSEVLFLTTANTLDTIPAPLLDRMEVIELPSYTREEKFQIAKRHLMPKQMKRHGLTGKNFKLYDDAIYDIIDNYTREAGVRNLERVVGSLCRKADKRLVAGEMTKVNIRDKNIEEYLGAKKYKPEKILDTDEVGVVTGLAWTSVGGETMPIEVAVMEGSGKIELTGSLGDVMKESAKAAISYVRSRAGDLLIDPEFYKNRDIHIHVPEGAVPKDGPSAGVTMCTAIVSALSNTPVRREVAMTGEITLRGRVLPIGGLREKTMAAYAAGVKTVIIPQDNVPDLEQVDDVVKEAVKFIPAAKIDTVLSNALIRNPALVPAGDDGCKTNVKLGEKKEIKNRFITQ
ncbi:endopeptidase La [Zongyangia hominis]|uniref:Lon protease n=1 Tax=Zongyangia hominis TaxID=2763677 RepID=A0A926EBY7_9FIRM|nr:endopeptidase La [Zongyangia hominis]MBC8569554.1 endopeptidase La [Zongyangia hominis]